MTDLQWQRKNMHAIEARLAPIAALADGVLYHDPASEHDIMVFKDSGVVYMYFHAQLNAEIQSRMAIQQPLHLISPYTRMAMMSLLWSDAIKRIYVIGLGGGRLPMVMHHVLPDAVIECAELEKDVLLLAKQYFGVAEDSRLKMVVKDGRRRLQEYRATEPLDIIVVDAFVGLGSGPHALATMEFFALCRQKLSPQGVVVINLLDNDKAHAQKRQTIMASFPVVMALRDEVRGNQVLFGCNDPLVTKEWLLQRAVAMQFSGLDFSLELLARNVELLPAPVMMRAAHQAVPLLHDIA